MRMTRCRLYPDHLKFYRIICMRRWPATATKVFVERFGWALHTKNGMESDQFDRQDTVYVVAQDDRGHVSGCARLLPTTRPYLLGEAFPQLLNGLAPPCSPDVWELSRFAAVDLNKQAATPGQFSNWPNFWRIRSYTGTRVIWCSTGWLS